MHVYYCIGLCNLMIVNVCMYNMRRNTHVDTNVTTDLYYQYV